MSDVDALPAGLADYLAGELGEPVTDLTVLNDGLNLVVAVSTPEAAPAYTLRRPNKFRATPLFNTLREEYAILERLSETAIPAPSPVLFCDDGDAPLPGPFQLTTYLDGEVVPVGDGLPERFRRPAARDRFGHLLVDTLADLHELPVERFEDVCERHSPRYQVEAAVDRLDAVERVTGREWPRLRTLADWLCENAPPDPELRLGHGDYRAGNVLLAGGDDPEIGGVLDWEVATLMDPLTDLGYFLLYWRDGGDRRVDLDELDGEYGEDELAALRELDEAGLCPFTTAPGSPTRRQLVERYEARTGRSFEDGRFYQAHAALMLATVWADLDRHAVERGAEPSKAPLVAYMGLVGEGLAEGRLRA